MVDVWRAAGTALDFYAPDLYDPNFVYWCRRYHRAGNPLYMPETRGGESGAANVFYAVGEEAGMGFSPFAIEDEMDPKGALAAELSRHRNRGPDAPGASGRRRRARIRPRQQTPLRRLHGQRATRCTSPSTRSSATHAQNGLRLIIPTGPEEFMGVGKGLPRYFTPRIGDRTPASAAIDEGKFEDGKWIPGRRLNGDENDQGKATGGLTPNR